MKSSTKNIVVNSRKFDGSLGKSWKADLLQFENSMILLRGIFDREIIHSDLGVIRPGTISLEFFWLDEFFNVFKFFEPEGNFRNFYCNVCLPPSFKDDVLSYVDLDVDVLISSDFSCKILDLDEFEVNADLYRYSSELKKIVNQSLERILLKFENRDFPFDSTDLIYSDYDL